MWLLVAVVELPPELPLLENAKNCLKLNTRERQKETLK